MSANPRRERLAERLWWALLRSWPRRFTILFFVPLLAAVLAYLLAPLYSTQMLHLEGLALTTVVEGGGSSRWRPCWRCCDGRRSWSPRSSC